MQQMGPMNNPKVPLRHVHRWRMALSGVVILAAGITIGIAGTMVFVRPAERRPPMDPNKAVGDMILRFRYQLKLTQEQEDKISAILGKGFVALD